MSLATVPHVDHEDQHGLVVDAVDHPLVPGAHSPKPWQVGRPAVVLISVDDLESLEETLDILSDPQLMAEIREAQAEAERGEFATEAQLRADLAARRARR